MRKIPVYPAARWNKLAEIIRRAWPWPGANARVSFKSGEHTISADTAQAWAHPWKLRCSYEYFTDAAGQTQGEWRARPKPGFVNGRDAYIPMPKDWQTGEDAGDVALTESPMPWLSLTDWRNPLEPSSVSMDDTGEVIYGAGEGYPEIFAAMGVRLPAPGGSTDSAPYDPERSREIRACDVWLNKPRLGSALGVTVGNALVDSQTSEVDTTYTDEYYVSVQGHSRLVAGSQFVPLGGQTIDTPFLGLPMNAGDAQIDQIKMATVFIISPPDAGDDAEPDETWETHPRHDVFWNLWHASRFTPAPNAPPDPLQITTGLGVGTLDYLANALLAPINAGFDEIQAYLANADMRGQFWNC